MRMVTELMGIEAIVSLRGSLETTTAGEARLYLDDVLAAGARRLLIDLQHLAFMSSAGLRVLLVVAKSLEAQGGELRLCNLDSNVREVFEISGFDTLLNVYGSRASAMEGWAVAMEGWG